MARPAAGSSQSSQPWAPRSSVTASTARWNAVPMPPHSRPMGRASTSQRSSIRAISLAERAARENDSLIKYTSSLVRSLPFHCSIPQTRCQETTRPPLPLCGKERGLPLWIQKKEKGEKRRTLMSRPKGGTAVEWGRAVIPRPAGRQSPLRPCGSSRPGSRCRQRSCHRRCGRCKGLSWRPPPRSPPRSWRR